MRFIFLAVFGMISAAPDIAAADEIRVLSGNAVQAPQKAAGELFTSKTGHHVTFLFANPAVIQQKLDAGERFELLVVPAAMLESLDKSGKLQPGSARPLARIGVGIAVRADGPKFDFSTPAAFRKMLLDARAIAYSDASSGGLSALSVKKVLENVGVFEAVQAKTVTMAQGQELIAKGEVDFGLFNASEIPRAPGVALAGLVPAAVQAYLQYDAGIPIGNSRPEIAQSLLEFLASPETRTFWMRAGIEQAPWQER